MGLSDETLDTIERLYGEGRFAQAFTVGTQVAPIRDWDGLRARLLGARLAGQLGHGKLASALTRAAYRRAPRNLRARTHRARMLLDEAGPWHTWQFLGHAPPDLDGSDADRADDLGFQATVLAAVRDFDRARKLLDQADALGSADPWRLIERAYVFQAEDRYADALAAATHALEERPALTAGVWSAAITLRALGRADEAIALLGNAITRIESFVLATLLINFLFQRGAWSEIGRVLERAEALAVLVPADARRWFDGVRSDVLYHCGDRTAARTFAERAGGFHAAIAARLGAFTGEPRQVLLAVPFVQQNFATCGPATLTALGTYWAMPVDHLRIAQEIAYGGTWDHAERQWAESSGCVTREFRVTWDAATALLDSGVPFSLATVAPTSGHLQAVVGYDELRRTLLVQDPTAGLLEYDADELLAAQRPHGPRGLALVPAAEASRLDAIALPDAVHYDTLYRLKLALVAHDRTGAERFCEILERDAADHPLAVTARWELAVYDGDASTGLRCAERLLAQFPDNEMLELRKLEYLGILGRRADRVAWIDRGCAREHPFPVWWSRSAAERRLDAREWPLAERHARRALRRLPTDATAYETFAFLRADQGAVAEAMDLARFAACLAPTIERSSDVYAWLAQRLGRIDEALEFLRTRAARAVAQSSLPSRTLFTVLERSYRLDEAFAALDTAIAARPGDGDLLLFGAIEHARDGRHERAAELLTTGRTVAHRTNWLRTDATLARARGDAAAALTLWQNVARAEPFDANAHREVANLIGQREGRRAALDYLRAVAAEQPYQLMLQRLLIERLGVREGGETAAEAERVLRHLIDTHPAYGWAHRELALNLLAQGRPAEATAAAAAGLAVEPFMAPSHSVAACVHVANGRADDARAALREAITLDVDDGFAIEELVRLGTNDAERREALAFVRSELERQTVFGTGISAWRVAARSVLRADDVLVLCREALTARSDLLPAWLETARQLLDMGHVSEATQLLGRAVERFPFMSEVHALLATARLRDGDHAGHLAELRRAAELAPGSLPALIALGNALHDAPELNEAMTVLTSAVAQAPGDPYAHGALADVLWASGERDRAIEHLETAIQLAPEYAWAWRMLRTWTRARNAPDRVLEVSRRLVEQRPGEVEAWLAHARLLSEAPDHLDELLTTLDRAMALSPRNIEIHDHRASALADAGRFDEAMAACRPAVYGDSIPTELQGRAAWVEERRGRRRDAIALMEKVVATTPSYAWGWDLLAQWLDAEGESARAVEASEWLTRLRPQESRAWVLLGHRQIAAARGPEGKASFARALELSPSDVWAAASLFDQQLHDHEIDAATATLAAMARYRDDEYVGKRRVMLAIARQDFAGALSLFRALCRTKTEDRVSIRAAGDALVNAGCAPDVNETLRDAVNAAEPDLNVALYWAERCATGTVGGEVDSMAALSRRGKVGIEACRAFLTAMTSVNSARLARSFARRCHDLVRRDTQMWAQYGYILLTAQRAEQVVRWLDDWEERGDLEAWMLLNLVAALRRLGCWTEAARVGRHAVGLRADHTTAAHQSWLALDDVLAGRYADARPRIATPVATTASSYYVAVSRIVEAVLALDDADLDLKGRNARAMLLLREARAQKIGRHAHEIAVAWYRAAAIVAASRGTWWAGVKRRWYQVLGSRL